MNKYFKIDINKAITLFQLSLVPVLLCFLNLVGGTSSVDVADFLLSDWSGVTCRFGATFPTGNRAASLCVYCQSSEPDSKPK